MSTYTGPIPPTPSTASTDAQWQNWWAYQGVLRDLRFEAERIAAAETLAARQAVLDAQHAERMAREDACAAATSALAEAQRAQAEAQRAGPASYGPTLDRLIAAWGAHDATLDRLTVALGSILVSGSIGGAGGGSSEGLTAADVGIVQGLAAALKSTP